MNLRLTRRAVALCGAVLLAVGSNAAAQTAADYQALRKEIDLLRERLIALQKEVDALKAQRLAAPSPAPAAAPPVTDIVLKLDRAPMRGSATARVALVEVSDFECPFCGRYFIQTQSQVMKNYVDSGKIRYAYLHFPIASHRYAFKAGEAAACAADQAKFWEMHDRLFSNQGTLAPNFLPEKGVGLLPDIDAYRACLAAAKHASDIRADQSVAQGAGVTATPTFFIGTLDAKTQTLKVARKIVGAKPFATFQQALDEVLSSAETAARK